MNSEILHKLYITQLRSEMSEEEVTIESDIEKTSYYIELLKFTPSSPLKKVFNCYRKNYREYGADDFNCLNSEIISNGHPLKKETVLFHGCGAKLCSPCRPVSCTTHPSKAIWHARKHRNHEINGKNIYIYIIKFLSDTDLKACVDFHDVKFGHEKEVLIQAGANFREQECTELFNGVYFINATVYI